MNTPRYAAAAAKLLRRHLPVSGGALPPPDRSVATIARAMQLRSRRRRLATAAVVAAAATIVLGVTVAGWRRPRPAQDAVISINVSPAGQGAVVHTDAGARPLASPGSVRAGQRIETPAEGGAKLQLSTGTAMNLAGTTSLRVESQGATERFSLLRGELSAHVAKLRLGQRFIIGTPDAEVEVRGTRFTVKVLAKPEACGSGSRTRLDVSEGVVELRSASLVVSIHAGQHWPSDCTAAALPSSAPALAPSRPSHAARAANAEQLSVLDHDGAARPPANPTATAVVERTSALTQQNDLFAEGVAKRRQGDVSGALRAFDELMARFPGSPLAQNAAVERMRLLAAERDPRAALEARRYLARYPHGFALEEARKLAETP
jgi:ferric-dicitrate binding protein FerR (iron transport regulator)